ncbi:ATP-dependent DNA helicase RecG [Persephonella sp.]
MKNLDTAKKIIEKALNSDDTYLNRLTGISNTLKKLLEGYIPEGFIEDIKDLDTLPPKKKRAFLNYLIKAVDEAREREKNKKLQKTHEEFYSLEDLRRLDIEDLKILKNIEKKAFRKIGLNNIEKVFFLPPKKYEDRRFKKLGKVKDGEYGLFEVEVLNVRKIKKRKLKTHIIAKQGFQFLDIYFVHDKPFLFTFFRKGKKVLIYGRISTYRNKKSMIQPEMFTEYDPVIHDRIVPVYSLKGDSTVKITSQTINHLRRGIFKILKKFLKFYPEYLPKEIIKKYKFPGIHNSIKNLHFPESSESIEHLNNFEAPFQKRLIFDDLFILQLAQILRKNLLLNEPSEEINIEDTLLEKFKESLPFELTEDQIKVIKEIFSDLKKKTPMNRLVQGDVGSGKTVVATASALAVALDGKQVAVMAPTEILANQHFNTFYNILKKFKIIPVLLTGSLSQREKKKIYRLIENGDVKVVIGTHALIQDQVKFKNLSLVIVDEQHRFGVVQRKALIEKSNKLPHTLIMTATPIPRTLQIANFGDLDVSTIKTLPKGRKKVETVLLFDDERENLYKKIKEEIKKGRQIFVVYPLVEESEKIDLKSAEEGYNHWKEKFPECSVLLLHGKMPQEEKDKIMLSFREGKGDILVSTTVIEVGVDIPNASVMVIEEAHRFGLSQIHQLRGRIGRGKYEGYCYMILPERFKYPLDDREEEKKRQSTVERLKILVRTTDGFKIAEEDLKLRGGGDIVGTAQSGKITFGIADLSRELDRNILEKARVEAEKITENDPFLNNNKLLRKIVLERYGDRFDIAGIG